jgi:hypothetical protein
MGRGKNLAWAARFRRLVRHYERLATTRAAFHLLGLARLMIAKRFSLLA